MPRPPDLYTHNQFTTVDSEHKGETVQCNHCTTWTGNVKTLNRKKEHLLKCPQYQAWRAAGNGQDLAPPNAYQKKDGAGAFGEEPYGSPYGGYGYSDPSVGPSHAPTMHRNRNYDISKSFDEFWDDSATQKCMRVRCRHCGFVRAKNTTRQVEHLSTCRDFLNSSEGQQALANGDLVPQHTDANGDIWRGGAPNPNLQGMINRRGPQKNPRSSMGNPYTPSRPVAPKPSLATHLLNRVADSLTDATHKSFLSHAGCGTLSAHALKQWLAQEIHISRALIPFVGSLVGKIRIPETSELQQDPTFRALDLLVSAASNMKKELEFLENTKTRYDMQVAPEEPKPATRGFVDLLVSASSPQSSLLEGLVVLYATEHLFCTSFQYAASFVSQMPASSTSYSLPSYLTPGQSGNPYATSTGNAPDNTHITALHDAFIPNWSSPNFARFVGACKSIVDESANSQTSGNGRAEMQACERVFKQVIYLWGGIWPDVDGMGEEEGLEQNNHQQNGSADKSIEVDDDGDADAEAAVDSPYGGTGLGAIVAHNRESIPGDIQRSQTLA